MRKWFRNALAIVGVTVVGVIAWLMLVQSTPPGQVYQGKPLSFWLEKYGSGVRLQPAGSETDEAVRHIGTNAIPVLLEMLQERDSAVRLKLVHLARKQHWIKFKLTPAEDRNTQAANGFHALGASASNAVPELIKLYRANNSIVAQRSIEVSLGSIGPAAKDAIPLLLANATNRNSSAVGVAFWALGEIDPNEAVRVRAVYALKTNDPAAAAKAGVR